MTQTQMPVKKIKQKLFFLSIHESWIKRKIIMWQELAQSPAIFFPKPLNDRLHNTSYNLQDTATNPISDKRHNLRQTS